MNSDISRYVLITGAAGGIGKAIVKEFSDVGYVVIASDCVPQPVDLICTHYVQSDLSEMMINKEYFNIIINKIQSFIGNNGLYALINNAAIQILGGVESLKIDDCNKTLNINLLAPLFLSQSLLKQLEKAKGSILNISSIHARLTKKNFLAYATSKAALSGMTKAMAVELGGRVRVNAIEPAAIETDMLKSGFSNSEEKYKLLAEYHPAGILGNVNELSRLVRSIVELDNGFFTGEVIGYDGGIGALLHDPA
jgi:NAD(P)-dependent dehydrogenase (short-subunit alcohol dehydrogenase family)